MLIIYTGNGKGKTTSAFGTMLRSMVLGKEVLLVQFMKPEKEKSILFLENAFPNFKCINYGINGFVRKNQIPKDLIMVCKYGFETLKKSYANKDLIVIDEIFAAIYFGLIDEKEVLEFTKQIKDKVDLIYTGRKASLKFMDLADIVTDMKAKKHHYDKGIKAKEGIDY